MAGKKRRVAITVSAGLLAWLACMTAVAQTMLHDAVAQTTLHDVAVAQTTLHDAAVAQTTLHDATVAQTTLRDDRGIVVTIVAPPQRIVSLLPSLTETVCALGACARLVGTDRHSNHPAAVRALPKTGGLDDASIEAIVSLRPDLVLLATSSRVTERLVSLGLPVLALEPRTSADVERVIGQLAQVLGGAAVAEAPTLWRRIQAQRAVAAQSLPAAARGLRVYVEVDSGPYAAGEASFIGETLSRLGAKNIVPASLGPFPKLNPEFVVRADPQVILIGAAGAASLRSRPGWQGLSALRDGRVCALNSEQADVLVRPGPRMGEAAVMLAACLAGTPLPGSAVP